MEFSTKPYFLILGALLTIMIAHAMYYYPLMPDIVAHKYDFDGKPFRFGSKNNMMVIYILVGLVPILLLALISKLPMRKMNLPNREYWLHEDNVDQARVIIIKAMFTFSVAQSLFIMALMDMLFKANLGQTDMPPYLMHVLFIYVGFMTIWMIRLFLVFRIPKGN